MGKPHSLKALPFSFLALLAIAGPAEAADPYAVITEKNLFRPDRKEWVIEKLDTKMMDKKVDAGNLQLYGTIIIGERKGALIQDKKANKNDKKSDLYSLGDYIGGYVLSAVEEKSVVLDYYGEKVTLYLHEGKETSKEPSKESSKELPLPPPEETPEPKEAMKRIEKQEEAREVKEGFPPGKIPEALAKSPFMSEDNMKKILEFNKEIMEEMKSSGGSLDQEGMKEKVEKFRERFLEEMEGMEK